MSNAYRWIPSIKAGGVVRNPMGAGRYAPIAPEDIAAVAVHALTSHTPAGKTVQATGGELLNTPQQVEILSRLLGKKIRCVEISLASAVDEMVENGFPKQVAEAVAESLTLVRDGASTVVTDAVRKITGKPPMTFEEWAKKRVVMFSWNKSRQQVNWRLGKWAGSIWA
jgi:uncharacterized protein YbjT (DUF2867 family)